MDRKNQGGIPNKQGRRYLINDETVIENKMYTICSDKIIKPQGIGRIPSTTTLAKMLF